jgi:hypothetical protein
MRRVGSAIGLHKGNEAFAHKVGLGEGNEIYDAEMAGLHIGLLSALHFIKEHNNVDKIFLFTDNTATVKSIFAIPQVQTSTLTKLLQ